MVNISDCKKVGILGGTFNPIHIGHLLMAEYAKKEAGLDVVLIMPTSKSYMKSNNNVPDGNIRLEMVQMCLEENDGLMASDFEIQRGGNTYTYETLLQLKKLYPNTDLYFIIGMDSLFSIEKWVKPEVIFANCNILVADRNDVAEDMVQAKINELKEQFGAQIFRINFPKIDISSTQIRENVRDGHSIRYMVHDNVWKYIYKNRLYEND